jgi:LYR motif-containing protein 4
MNGAAKREAVALYRKLLRTSSKCNDYNYREFLVRRVKQDFRSSSSNTSSTPEDLMLAAKLKLEEVQRIVTVQNLYAVDQSVMNHVK